LDGYLLETTTLSAILDSGHAKHGTATSAIAALDSSAPKYVSVIALAELMFGERLVVEFAGRSMPELAEIINQARSYAPLDVTRHTAAEYAELKAILAKTYLAKAMRRERPRWLENWVDKATGQTLQVDENDLWMCAQARERNLVLVTADAKMQRVSQADPTVVMLFI
jgi:predicted nucleic acid-binding protein